ncbi:hypothetical protein PMZ80_011287 [Knufia obscura]|uniref:Alpha/beta hydrolase fold-3 domain-containing protein n=4 Tax=Trichomeriaceae TaxID=1233474 RepID=A0AAN8I620_9EURO|nr:hypothetical protein LTR51_000935 [Lithohypha guttulata]KAK5310487.1 hypothetical protein LTR70_009433 [Exophiala xenobiotica]KAK5936477.1 hypothetical protein PMZ80_011287 [Knufia obscura]KAK5956432.1 hypothetical protein OHC33_003009 [Knufia fluminis]KAK5079445.1 hypothetical protein LTR24_009285 [Lithohypha guttulata]
MPQPRWLIGLQASILRKSMEFGMFINALHSPRPPAPSFCRRIPVTISRRKGFIDLLFYTPKDYSMPHGVDTGRRYPVMVNFHSGGFTLGRASDDAPWASIVVEVVHAVVVCVEYRLAPQFPFPTAVEDGADALMYIMQRAEELKLDAERICVSGFSSGGNMAFTVPLLLQSENRRMRTDRESSGESVASTAPRTVQQVALIVSWYPTTDYATYTREERRKCNTQPGKEPPKFFTTLFDAAYIHPIYEVSLSNPYLSPSLAPDDMLRKLPDDVLIYTCEWDGLRAEAERFKAYLANELQKRVRYRMVPEVTHAWDKKPHLKGNGFEESVYREACFEIKRIFDDGLARKS